jgi:dihydroorotase
MAAHDPLLIRNVRPLASSPIDLLVAEGRLAAIGPDLTAPGAEVIEGGGRLAFPGFVDAHAHVDKTLIASAGTGTRSAPRCWTRSRTSATSGANAASTPTSNPPGSPGG